MSELLGGLVAIIIEAILKVFTSRIFVKAILSAFVYVFLFAIIPTLIVLLVPQSIMDSVNGLVQMLEGGSTTIGCAGCGTAVQVVQFGQGVAYILDWLCFWDWLGVMLPAMAVAFLFKRI